MEHLTKELLDQYKGNPFKVNIKLDYSSVVVNKTDSEITFESSREKRVTLLSYVTRHRILSPGVDELAMNFSRFKENGRYYFEYKNPCFDYFFDSGRDSGLYFSYFQTESGQLDFDYDREMETSASYDELYDWIESYPEQFEDEEGLVVQINLPSSNSFAMFKIINPKFKLLKKLLTYNRSTTAVTRNFLKKNYDLCFEEIKTQHNHLDRLNTVLTKANDVMLFVAEQAAYNDKLMEMFSSNLHPYRHKDLLFSQAPGAPEVVFEFGQYPHLLTVYGEEALKDVFAFCVFYVVAAIEKRPELEINNSVVIDGLKQIRN